LHTGTDKTKASKTAGFFGEIQKIRRHLFARGSKGLDNYKVFENLCIMKITLHKK